MKAKFLCITGLLVSSLFSSALLSALPVRLFSDAAFAMPLENKDADFYRYGVSCDVGGGATFFDVFDVVGGIGFERVRINTLSPTWLELPSSFIGAGLVSNAIPNLRLRAGAEAGIVFAGYRFLSTLSAEDTAARVGFELSATTSLTQKRFEIEPFAGAQWYFLKPANDSFYREIRAGIRINFCVSQR